MAYESGTGYSGYSGYSYNPYSYNNNNYYYKQYGQQNTTPYGSAYMQYYYQNLANQAAKYNPQQTRRGSRAYNYMYNKDVGQKDYGKVDTTSTEQHYLNSKWAGFQGAYSPELNAAGKQYSKPASRGSHGYAREQATAGTYSYVPKSYNPASGWANYGKYPSAYDPWGTGKYDNWDYSGGKSSGGGGGYTPYTWPSYKGKKGGGTAYPFSTWRAPGGGAGVGTQQRPTIRYTGQQTKPTQYRGGQQQQRIAYRPNQEQMMRWQQQLTNWRV